MKIVNIHKVKIIFKSVFRNMYFPLLIIYFKNRKINLSNQTLLIIKTDAIGDYILFRNFLEEIRNSDRYKNYRITLLGNIRWKDLCLSLDKKFIDNFIWLDRKKYLNNPFYTFQILKQINDFGFEILFQPTYWREYYIDLITQVTNTNETIGSNGYVFYYTASQRKSSKYFYTKTINSNSSEFEFFKVKRYVENLIVTPSKIQYPSIKIQTNINIVNGDYIVIFPSASAAYKQWSPKKFAALIEQIQKEFDIKIVIAGAKSDRIIFDRIISEIIDSKIDIIDYVGKTDLPELLNLLKSCKVMISNDTGAMHMAVALGVKTICIANGRHYGRFIPYPKGLRNNLITVLPKSINVGKLTESDVEKMNLEDFNPDIEEISTENVFSEFVSLIKS